VRETRTAPEIPLGGRARTVQWIEGDQVREETTVYMNLLPDSLRGPGAPAKDPNEPLMELRAIWSPADGVWRHWSPEGEKVYVEISPESLKAQWEGDQSLSEIGRMFGGNPDLVTDIGIQVDPAGAESSLVGLAARPHAMSAIVRLHSLEHDLTDSLRVTRRVWLAPAIQGTEVPARISPAWTGEQAILMIQFMVLPVLREAVQRLDAELDRLPGHVLRDELRLESAARAESGVLLLEKEVLEIRREPSRPERFRVPDGYVRKISESGR